MDYVVERSGNTAKVTIKEGNNTSFDTELLSNADNIDGWYAHLKFLQLTESSKIDALLDLTSRLLNIDISPDNFKKDLATFLSMLQAIFKLLEEIILEE